MKDRRWPPTGNPARPRWFSSTPRRRSRGRPLAGGSPGAFVFLALVVGNQLDLEVEGQGAELAGEAVFLCGEGADVSHDDFSFRVEQGRASASLL